MKPTAFVLLFYGLTTPAWAPQVPDWNSTDILSNASMKLLACRE
jgi:hypothetical protein